ncbi:MAG TPA: tyrosine-type recombinase/integrase [Candidatus Udaeobacter sp.]|nr:tyrosine-type recombinase/integrase [Candidatus Udaeobacter sp.]
MRKTAIRLSKVKVGNGQRLWCVTWPRIGKGRNRQFFKDKDEAETVLQQKLIEQENFGTAGLSFNEQQRVEYLECAKKLHPFGRTITDAVAHYVGYLEASAKSCTAVELVKKLIDAKEKDGASVRHVDDLRSRLNIFAEKFDGQPVATITSAEIDNWLRSLPVSPVTRNHYRRLIVLAFNFAVQHGYATGNPASGNKTAKAKEPKSKPGILEVEQARALLENASSEILPYVAIGLFGGLRRAELERLDWSEVDFDGGHIEVTAEKSKSKQANRFITIQPNLREWLLPFRKPKGNVTPRENFRQLFYQAREAAGIDEWPDNALRHSFASYHVAHFKDAKALALEMGHTDSGVLYNHYRALVKPKQAERYWKIAPAVAGKKVIQFASP